MASDVLFARGLAEEIRSSGRPRTWRKMTTVLSAYGVHRLTDTVRARVAKDFADAGLECEPSMLEADRYGSVRLSLRGAASPSATLAAEPGALPAGVIAIEMQDGRWETSLLPAGRSGTAVVDLDVALLATEGLYDVLGVRLSGLDEATLADLVKEDEQSGFKRRTAGSVRRASVYIAGLGGAAGTGTGANEPSGTEDSVRVSLGLVEFAVGDGWLLIARHPAQVYVGGRLEDRRQVLQAGRDYLRDLHDFGLVESASAEEASLAVLKHAVTSFGRARAYLGSYLETWRIENGPGGSNDRGLLISLQATAPLLIDTLSPLRHPSVLSWLGGGLHGPARDVQEQVERDLDGLRALSETTAGVLSLVHQAQSEDYQRGLATLAAVLLAPGLVASVFSANASLSSSPIDLIWLFAAMIAAGILTQVLIARRLRPRTEPRQAEGGTG